MENKLKGGWDKVEVGNIMYSGSTKYEIVGIAGLVIFFRGIGQQNNSLSTGCIDQYMNAGYKIMGADWEKAEDAIAYLQSKGMIKDGKVITN